MQNPTSAGFRLWRAERQDVSAIRVSEVHEHGTEEREASTENGRNVAANKSENHQAIWVAFL